MTRLRKPTGGTLALAAGLTLLLGGIDRADPPVEVRAAALPDAGAGDGPDTGGAGAPEPAEPTALTLSVDPALTSDLAEIPGLRDGDPPRPVGRMQDADGVTTDVVLDEVVVTYTDEADLDRFVAEVDGAIVDRFDDAGEPVRDALVAFPRFEVDDPAAVAAAMVALEDDLAGDWIVGDPAVLAVLDLLGRADDAGVTAMPNVLHDADGFGEGSTVDGSASATYNGTPYGSDAFGWPYVASGTSQDVGLDDAWRLLADVGAFDPKPDGWAHRVKIMVVDQGFRLNDDVPDHRTIRRADWGEQASDGYSSTAPWHGASVVNALVGEVDNGFGGAGPAGPIDPALIAVGDARPASWDNVRSLVRLVDQHRPDIINMSYRASVTSARLAYQDFYERKFSTIKHDYGALPFASAGNDGADIDAKRRGAVVERVLYLPCEARHVACVGGMGEDTTVRAGTGCGSTAGSNYGTLTGGRSVEIWGPYWVIAQSGTSGQPGRACGTSFASPFVAGVAALVMAADPSLDPDGVWDILKETAHHGGIGGEVTGHQRRINARDAVRRAHGEPIARPTVTITSPRHDDEFVVGTWVELTAETRDHLGRSQLPVTWMSNKDGTLTGPVTSDSFTEQLTPGLHAIVATVTDRLGQTAHDQVLVRVTPRPVEVTITSPGDGEALPSTADVTLVGDAIDASRPLETIPGTELRWTITHTSDPATPVPEATGRTAVLPAGALAPGSYRAVLAVTLDGHTTSETVDFTVVEPDPDAPTVTMFSPASGFQYTTQTATVTLRLRGEAVDAAGDPVPGTQLRWLARRGAEERLLCAGTHVPGGQSADGDIAVLHGCADVEADLDVPLGTSAWSIVLEAHVPGAPTGTAVRAVTVTSTPPAVP